MHLKHKEYEIKITKMAGYLSDYYIDRAIESDDFSDISSYLIDYFSLLHVWVTDISERRERLLDSLSRPPFQHVVRSSCLVIRSCKCGLFSHKFKRHINVGKGKRRQNNHVQMQFSH